MEAKGEKMDGVTIISAVAPKLPEFYTQNPKLWFTRAESEFATCCPVITAERTKFCHVVKALDQATALRVEDVLDNADEPNPYTKLKNRLLEVFSLTDREKASRVLDYPELGDTSALKMAEDIERWLGKEGHHLLVKELMFRRLPEAVRVVLENDDEKDIRALAKKADKLRAVSNASLAAIRPTTARQLPIAPKTHQAKKQARLCFYHKRFGSGARVCRAPCEFEIQGNGNAGRE